LELEPGTGRVSLSGVVFDDAFVVSAENSISQVAGVTSVVNDVRVLSHSVYGP
jgi:osmotically-inducible protein OsmY